jgi:hypothetical protein
MVVLLERVGDMQVLACAAQASWRGFKFSVWMCVPRDTRNQT